MKKMIHIDFIQEIFNILNSFGKFVFFLEHTDIEFERLQYYPEFLFIKTFVEEAVSEDEIYHSNDDDIYDVDR